MKELVVVVGLSLLGVILFSMILGPSENSLRGKSQDVMSKTVTEYVGE